MKYLIYVTVLFFFKQDSLLKKATNDFSKQSPFLFIHLKQVNYKSSNFYCIKNDDLFRLLYDDSKISMKNYSSLVFDAIENKKDIIFKKNNYRKLIIYQFKANNKIICTLNKKNIEQIKHLYFRGNMMKKELTNLFKQQIMYSLSLKGVFISTDDESGRYMIY